MSRSDAIDPFFLAGEVHALVAFAQVIAATHPNPRLALEHFLAAEQAALAKIETILADDALVAGFQFAMQKIRAELEDAAGTQSDLHKG